MLVETGSCVCINNEDDTATPYEVLVADSQYFVLGQIVALNEECTELQTDLENIAIYPNDGSKSLKEMNMFIAD